MLSGIKAIQKTSEKVSICINQLLETGLFENENKAFVVLRASLKALRDKLSPEEAIQLGGQLPALLRGFYYEGWNLKTHSNSRHEEEFLRDIKFYMNGHDDVDLDLAAPVCMKAILDMIDQAEAIDVLHQLPQEIRALCPGD